MGKHARVQEELRAAMGGSLNQTALKCPTPNQTRATANALPDHSVIVLEKDRFEREILPMVTTAVQWRSFYRQCVRAGGLRV